MYEFILSQGLVRNVLLIISKRLYHIYGLVGLEELDDLD
jgi:hypothetical protein